jgi:hypothetical protein
MSVEDASFVYDRLFFAFALERQLVQSGFVYAGNESDLLLWLLIDSWERISCLLWKHNLENLS